LSLHNHQQCPVCHGAVNIENSVTEDLGEHEVTYLYCDFCQTGWETLWQRVKGGALELKLNVTYRARDDALKLGMFLQRMKDAVAA